MAAETKWRPKIRSRHSEVVSFIGRSGEVSTFPLSIISPHLSSITRCPISRFSLLKPFPDQISRDTSLSHDPAPQSIMLATSNSPTIQNRNRQITQRLFCFPYAGGAAPIYRDWGNKLPASIEVHPVQLPGHGNRLSEPLCKRVEPLVESMVEALKPYLEGSFSFFGHSMGAIISFELAHLLSREHKSGPAHLFLSGRPAPHLTRKGPPTYDLPESEFIEELRQLQGTPSEILEHPEVMAVLSPILRADLEICQTYEYTAQTAA
jgi:surfactin synthase thioesterase subunit